MKTYLFIIFSLLTTSGLKAQALAPSIDSTSIVVDSTGKRYTYDSWKDFIASTRYGLKHYDTDAANKFVIYKMSEADRDQMFANLPKPTESPAFKAGQDFGYFKIQALDGFAIGPDELAGKTLVLNFWDIKDPACQEELPALNEVAERYKEDKDVVFIAIGLGAGYPMKKFVKEHPLQYHLVADGKSLAASNNVDLYPTNVIINKKGKVVFSNVGSHPAIAYWLKKSIEESKAN